MAGANHHPFRCEDLTNLRASRQFESQFMNSELSDSALIYFSSVSAPELSYALEKFYANARKQDFS